VARGNLIGDQSWEQRVHLPRCVIEFHFPDDGESRDILRSEDRFIFLPVRSLRIAPICRPIRSQSNNAQAKAQKYHDRFIHRFSITDFETKPWLWPGFEVR